MGWKKVERNTVDIKAKNPGTQIVGTYTGFKKIKTELGENVIWEFHDEDGKPFGVYGFTNLNFQMEGVAPGTSCRLTYNGKATTAKEAIWFSPACIVPNMGQLSLLAGVA